MRPTSLALLCIALAASAAAQTPVVIGAGTDEWNTRTPAATDPTGDAAATADLTALWVTSDDSYLYVAFEVAAPVLLNEGNGLRLVVDVDDDAATGTPVHGLGAELDWRFGQRQGTLVSGGTTRNVYAGQVGLWTAPQVTSTRFEVALPRQPGLGERAVLTGDRVRLAVLGGTGDVIPAETGGLVVDLSSAPHPRAAVDLGKQDVGHVRLMAYNVLRDRLTGATYEAAYRRVLRAIRPDVAIVVEVYDSSGPAVAARIGALLGDPSGTWHGAKAGPDVIVAARTDVSLVEEVRGNGLFRVASPDGGPDWIVAALHPPCCTNDTGRQAELDALVAAVRRLRANGTIPADAPFVVGGDMNFVGDARQLVTLLNGDIADEATYGPDAPFDLDGSALDAAAPLATGVPAAFTWRNATSSYPAGQLDYVAYSDAVLASGNAFVLYTPGLTAEERTAYGLQRDDTAGLDEAASSGPFASDHLPVVVDLYARPIVAVESTPGGAVEIVSVAPNPVRQSTTVRVQTGQAGRVEVALVDALGRRVRSAEAVASGPGEIVVPLDAVGLAAGVYVVRVTTPGGSASRRVVVAR